MVNTVVTFGNNRLSSTPVVIKTDEKIFSLQRKIYLIIGIFLSSIIVIPNILSIANNQDDFAYHLLFIVHASFLLLFFISTTIYRNIGDGITTISSLILFAIYKTIHYLIRYRYCRINSRKDFLLTTIQLTLILIFVIIYILWTYLLIRDKYYKANSTKNIQSKQKRIFFSLLTLNLMLTVSSLILNIRSQENFGLYHILLFSIGIPLILFWYTTGILMSIYRNCLCITLFYFFSLIQPFHIVYLIFQSLNEYQGLQTDNEIYQFFPLFIIIFVCISTNFFVHLFTTITACWMLTKTDKIILNTHWMLKSI